MDLLEEDQPKVKDYIITIILWLVTVVLGGIAFFTGRRVILSTYYRFFPGYSQKSGSDPLALLNILVSLPLAFLVVAIIIGGFEYHLGSKNRIGKEESNWMFTRTLAIEMGLLLLAQFL